MRWMKAAVFVLLLMGCAAPGTPKLRTGNDDGEGPLVPGCKNVSVATRVGRYVTDSYLSTWGSAWFEGAMQGAGEGVPGGGPFAMLPSQGLRRPAVAPNRIFNHLPSSLGPFCMTYRGEVRAVSRVVAETMPRLGNPVVVSKEEDGLFETEFLERRNEVARWLDSYVVAVTAEERGRTVVYVLRILYVSRDNRTFNQGISVGRNEAWFLIQVADRFR